MTGTRIRTTGRVTWKPDHLRLLVQALQGAYTPTWTCPNREEQRRGTARIETRPIAGRGMDPLLRRWTADNHHQDWSEKRHLQPETMPSHTNTAIIGPHTMAARRRRKNQTSNIRVTSMVSTEATTLAAIAENQQSFKRVVPTCSARLDPDQCPAQNQNPGHLRRCLHLRRRRHGFLITSLSPVPEHQPPSMWPETDVEMRLSGQCRRCHPAAPPRLEVAQG